MQAVTPGGESGTLVVTWQRSSSNDVAGYEVGYGTDQFSSSLEYAGDVDQFVLNGLTSGTLYYIYVIFYDGEGNISDNSAYMTGAPQ